MWIIISTPDGLTSTTAWLLLWHICGFTLASCYTRRSNCTPAGLETEVVKGCVGRSGSRSSSIVVECDDERLRRTQRTSSSELRSGNQRDDSETRSFHIFRVRVRSVFSAHVRCVQRKSSTGVINHLSMNASLAVRRASGSQVNIPRMSYRNWVFSSPGGIVVTKSSKDAFGMGTSLRQLPDRESAIRVFTSLAKVNEQLGSTDLVHRNMSQKSGSA